MGWDLDFDTPLYRNIDYTHITHGVTDPQEFLQHDRLHQPTMTYMYLLVVILVLEIRV